MPYNPALSSCLKASSLLNLHLVAIFSALNQTGAERSRDNKSATVVRQTTAGRAILQRGRVSPMRRMRWPVRVLQPKHNKWMDYNKTLLAMCVAVAQVLIRGIHQVNNQLLTWDSSSHQLHTP